MGREFSSASSSASTWSSHLGSDSDSVQVKALLTATMAQRARLRRAFSIGMQRIASAAAVEKWGRPFHFAFSLPVSPESFRGRLQRLPRAFLGQPAGGEVA